MAAPQELPDRIKRSMEDLPYGKRWKRAYEAAITRTTFAAAIGFASGEEYIVSATTPSMTTSTTRSGRCGQ